MSGLRGSSSVLEQLNGTRIVKVIDRGLRNKPIIVCACSIFRSTMAEASGSGELQLPDFRSDNKPNQPPQFDFPKREFGKTKPVKRAFQAQWFMKWKWFHYD